MNPTSIQLIAALLFAVAVVHTFSTRFFERLAHSQPQHAGIWHLLGEVEVVFGFWAMILILFIFLSDGKHEAIGYLESRDFTEPMFVFVIMVIAGTRPILDLAAAWVQRIAHLLPINTGTATYCLLLSFVPLLGSFITEPAAMTLAAIMLRDIVLGKEVSTRLKYATVGVLFVNVSIGGTLTPFAAPPVLMVAGKWNWDMAFMMMTFGWKAALAVILNALTVTWLFRHELKLISQTGESSELATPWLIVVIHVVFLALVVILAHHPVVFMGIFLFFLGFTAAYHQYQNPLILREALLVAFFLAGLVVLGGQQQWWLQPLLMDMNETTVYFGATLLTAVTDNAALTYLGSLVEGLSEEFKISLVAGAVTGGGLTVIANAPNPAGFSILKSKFDEQSIHPLGLLMAALPPTLVAIIAFRVL
ncbi:hypothetical protein ABF87_07340 [Nitrosomonas sp. JL21]|uniref:putative Na+/H+ antiporter n=1 Tax=Nitrosomonas sp. JL21 TaxID=153949 RepID=UPI00136E86B3|nr:putative Na+/H+ antiporter [Nitrosomonas sp. JL21]MBL8497621.1 putative Na+/H+ antiporter [Nitrosomonas sp.]MCC7092286.1 putative Na+/H+ antiporter [Nitrosomonas sp.]MXS77782.1 hypothetical protein [Nitrosomonas sp. JL21]